MNSVKTHKSMFMFEVATVPLPVNGLVAYRCRYRSLFIEKPLRETQGICQENNLPTIADHSPITNPHWTFLPNSVLHSISQEGWEKSYGESMLYLAFDLALNPHDCQLVSTDGSAEMIFDVHGEALPVALHCDYSCGGFDNSRYHMKLAFEHLMNHPEVKNLDKSSIPHYNASLTKTETLSFMWTPSVENYRKAWAWCLEQDRMYPSTLLRQAMFELDLLGLRACGAAKYDKYYDHDPEVYRDDEDDYYD